MKKSVRLYIDGTVQGVFFRTFLKENADRNNVKGFTRNLEDGRVEVFICLWDKLALYIKWVFFVPRLF